MRALVIMLAVIWQRRTYGLLQKNALKCCRPQIVLFSTIESGNNGKNEVEPPRRRLRLPRLVNDIDNEISKRKKPSFSRVKLGSEEDIVKAEMDDRLKNAERWTSKQLTDEETDMLNRALGIDAEILAAMEGKKAASKSKKPKADLLDDAADTKRLRGFLELNPYICSGCGTNFQSKSADSPGFLPSEKLQEHRQNAGKIREQQEAIKILQMAGLQIGSDAANEVLAAGNTHPDVIRGVNQLAGVVTKRPEAVPQEPAEEPAALAVDENYYETRRQHYAALQKDKNYAASAARDSRTPPSDAVCICQRCFRLQQYGTVEESLRPGWSDNELLTPERFQTLLGSIKDTEGVVLCIVDMFDIQGSLLPSLRAIAGKNPIVIAANKLDLLPSDASEDRLTGWVHSAVKAACGLVSPRDKQEKTTKEYFARGWSAREKESDHEGVLSRANVHLVSCQSGHGMDKLMRSLMAMAAEHGSRVYVMGAANVGKSSFINRLLSTNYQRSPRGKSAVPQATVSNLPGTTLDFLKIRLPNGVTMIDTPGLLNSGQLTSRLTPAELKQVIPIKPINAVTLRVAEGKCILLGGLAKVELMDARPFFLTFFVSNEVKIHPTDSTKADDYIDKHIGSLLFPPASPERLSQLGPFEAKVFEVEGEGWKQSKMDLVIAGLGWVSVTGSGVANIKVTVPKGTAVTLRPSLLPFEARQSTAKFTGGRILKTSGRSRNGYGWRA